MSFDFSTLVTDRTQADVNRVKQIAEKIKNGTASESELAEFNGAAMKGAYNYTDLNRVTAAMEALKAKLEGYGYAVPGYQRIKVPHHVTEGGSKLPEGYTRLTYIESDGSQYIKTGVYHNQETCPTLRMVLDATIMSTTGAALNGAASYQSYYAGQMNGQIYYSTYHADVGTGVSYSAVSRCTYDLDNASKMFRVLAGGSVLVETGTTVGIPEGNKELYLCAYNSTADGTASGLFAQRLYGGRYYVNGVIVRDFVPCINPSGEAGLYDLVTAAFFGNSGTGSFVAGAIPRELPEGYTQVEYIQSSGTQHIDTGVSGSVPLKVELTIETLTGTSTVDKMPMASIDGTNTTVPVYWSYSTWYTEIGKTNGTSASGTLTDNTKYDVVFTATSTKYSLVVNGATLVEKTGSLTGSTKSLFLFARNKNGTASHQATAKVYGLKMYSNDVLARDFVPCKNSDGVIGLYDLVNDVFYQNAGSGVFTAGEEVVAPATASVMDVSDNVAEYDPYTWYEFDWPTTETMTVYFLNVAALRSVFAVMKSTPSVPKDAVGFMVQEANDIEKILVDINELLIKSTQDWFYSGELFAGEV